MAWANWQLSQVAVASGCAVRNFLPLRHELCICVLVCKVDTCLRTENSTNQWYNFFSNFQSIFKRLVLKPKKTTKRNSCNQIVPRQGDIQFFQDFVAVGKIHLTFRKRSKKWHWQRNLVPLDRCNHAITKSNGFAAALWNEHIWKNENNLKVMLLY